MCFSSIFWKNLISRAIEKGIETKGDDIIAKSSENYISVQKGFLKFLSSFRFGMLI